MLAERETVMYYDIEQFGNEEACFGCGGEGVLYADGYGCSVCSSCGGSGVAEEDDTYNELIGEVA